MLEQLKKLTAEPGFQKYFRNTSWLLGEKVLRMFVSLIVSIWVTRYLGPERFGILSYAQSLVALFAAFASLGLDAIVIKDLVGGSRSSASVLGSAFAIKLGGALAAIGLLVSSFLVVSYGADTELLVMIIASSYLFQSFGVIDFYFQSRVKSRYSVLANSCALFVTSIIKIVLIVSGAELVYFAIVFVIDSALVAMGLLLFYVVGNKQNPWNWRFEPSVAADLFKRSLPFAMSGLVITLYVKVDKIMLMQLAGSDAVGIYSAAAVLSETWFFVPTVVTASLFPSIIAAKEHSETKYQSRMLALFSLLFWVALIVALPISLFSGYIVSILYGTAYLEAGAVLQAHVWTAVFVSLGMPVSKWFVVEGMERYALYRALVGAFANVVLNLLLIPPLGPYGAALATLITSFTTAILFNLVNHKLRSVLYMQLRSVLLPFNAISAAR